MKGKIIIEGNSSRKLIFVITLIVFTLLFNTLLVDIIADFISSLLEIYLKANVDPTTSNVYVDSDSDGMKMLVFIFSLVLSSVLSGLIYTNYGSRKFILTTQGISGKKGFKNFFIPIEKVKRASIVNLTRSLSIDTELGIYNFSFIENLKEIHCEVEKLINTTSIHESILNLTTAEADELLKLKKLLDAGIISQEEFEIKKKEII